MEEKEAVKKNTVKKRRSLSIKGKLILLAAVVTLTFVGTGVLVFLNLVNISNIWDIYKTQVNQRERSLSEMKTHIGFNGVVHHFKNYILRQDDALVKEMQDSHILFMKAMNEYISIPGITDRERRNLELIIRTFYNYSMNILKAKKLFEEGKTIREVDQAVSIEDADAFYSFDWLKTYISDLVKDGDEKISQAIENMLYQVYGIYAAALAFTIIFSLVISSSISGKLKKILIITNEIAEGDLSQRVNMYTKDEIGKLADNFNIAIINLQDIIKSVKNTSEESRQIGRSLSANVEQVTSTISQINVKIGSIRKHSEKLYDNISSSSTSLEEILANTTNLVSQISQQASAVEQTSASMEEITASIESVSRITGEKKESVDALLEITHSGGEKVKKTNEIITKISQSIDDMLEMISVINNIASQTNLLSMNAAIEAAHAGDFGKGFAVVADEIKKLAENTSKNSKMISSTLKGVIDRINQSLTSSQESGETFNRITNEVSEVVNAFTEIKSSTDELAKGTEEIMSATSTLLGITDEIRNGSSEIQTGAEEINNALVQIKDISNENLEGINEISSGSQDIIKVADQISQLSVANNEFISKLIDEVERFKTGQENL
jgi:methyl-accepting chemotaxis protein